MSIPTQHPERLTELPGPRSLALGQRLGRVESRNVTCLAPESPIFWDRARGSNVWDVDGNRFIDLGAAFAVANTGHSHPRVVEALALQADRLLHGMGDVHPTAPKVELLERLSRLFPGSEPARAVLSSSGSDAVESALKTALLATGRAGVMAFEGGYHGLALGVLAATWRSDFREPFAAQLPDNVRFAKFGDLADLRRVAAESESDIGAVLLEPIQGRGGIRIPPDGFLQALRELCDARGWLLIADEIFTGFGRTGRWFACEHEQVVPDLLCVGKGLASGMPLSACIGRDSVMQAWPASDGEALHTQTFLGHPAGCAAALASLSVLEDEKLIEASREDGEFALRRLRAELDGRTDVLDTRGRGLMLGIELRSHELAIEVCRAALGRGVILLPSGDDGRVLSITPPLSIGRDALAHALELVTGCLPSR